MIVHIQEKLPGGSFSKNLVAFYYHQLAPHVIAELAPVIVRLISPEQSD